MRELIQIMIVFVLFFVMTFGLGFILNMLIKTSWLPVYLYVIVVAGLAVYAAANQGDLLENLSKYTYIDYLTGLGGLAGAVFSGLAIRALRTRGYKMF